MLSVMRYINDNDFKIVYVNNMLNVVNYKKINYMEDSKISLSSNDFNINVTGKDLRVKKLLDNEIAIVGTFSTIEFKK